MLLITCLCTLDIEQRGLSWNSDLEVANSQIAAPPPVGESALSLLKCLSLNPAGAHTWRASCAQPLLSFLIFSGSMRRLFPSKQRSSCPSLLPPPSQTPTIKDLKSRCREDFTLERSEIRRETDKQSIRQQQRQEQMGSNERKTQRERW